MENLKVEIDVDKELDDLYDEMHETLIKEVKQSYIDINEEMLEKFNDLYADFELYQQRVEEALENVICFIQDGMETPFGVSTEDFNRMFEPLKRHYK